MKPNEAIKSGSHSLFKARSFRSFCQMMVITLLCSSQFYCFIADVSLLGLALVLFLEEVHVPKCPSQLGQTKTEGFVMEVPVAHLKLSGVQSKSQESFSPDYFPFSSSETCVDELCCCTKSEWSCDGRKLSYF